MDFKVLTAEEYQDIKQDIACLRKLFVDSVTEIKHLKDNRLLSVKELCAYTGFSIDWVNKHKEDIGYSQIGCKDLRFYKEDVDRYFLNHKIQSKYK